MSRRKKASAAQKAWTLADSTSKQLALLVKEQTKSRARIAILIGGAAVLLLGLVAAIVFWPASPKPSAPSVTDKPVTQAPAADAVAPEKLRGKRSVATLLNGPPPPSLRALPSHAERADPEELARSIANDKTGAVQLCYERELKKNPRLRGKVVVALDLKAPHSVARVTVRDTLKRSSFTQCVKSTMRKVYFSDIREDLSIEIPFVLRSPDF